MAGLKEIKIRIKSVKSTKKITYAMKLVAATKMRSAQDAVTKSKAYSSAINRMLSAILSTADATDLEHPLLQRRDVKKIRLIVIGANRGLCGGYNTNINKQIEQFFARQKSENPGAEIETFLLGSKLEEVFGRNKFPITKCYKDLSEEPESWPITELCKQAAADFENSSIDQLYIINTEFRSALDMKAKCDLALPFSVDDLEAESSFETEEAESLTKFEPSTAEVFAALLPRILMMKVQQAALDAKASEHASRMTAMDNATKNAEDLIKSLTKTHNRLRQASITGEILDIIGGANSVKNG